MAELRTHRDLVEHGETAIVSALLSLPAAYTVLPHLILPGQQWQHDPDDIDAVVLGPNGIFLLEYKHWHGRIVVAQSGPWQHGYVSGGAEERRNPLPHLAEKSRCLREFLTARDFTLPPIHVAVAFPDRTPIDGAEVSDGLDMLGPVPMLNAGQIATWLARAGEPGSLSREVQSAIAEQLRPNTPRRLVNQYQLTSRLTREDEKTTYLAFDTVLERPVLLQELAYDPYQQPAQLERVRNELLREAKLTMQLRHDHIVNVEHVIPRDDCYYVVTEWIDNGLTLAEVFARRGNVALAIPEVIGIGRAIASALEYAHSQGIVHRDIRPENVLVAPSGIVKVANFGLAKKADMGTRSTFDLRQMAQENPYVAPEFRLGQAGPHMVDQRADIFSLGVVLYQLLTGKLPHHLDEKFYEPPSRFNPGVPPALDAAIEKALRFDPAQRFSTMAAFRERLLHWESAPDNEQARYVQRKLVKRTRNSLVYQAFDLKLQRQVGLKKLLLEPRLTEAERLSQLQHLLREAQLASSLVQPHIISVFDHFIEDGDGYIVMEWLEGPNLRELMEAKAQLGFEVVRAIAQQVGEALQYAHSQGVVHRDIKPENIIFHQGQATVLDFGIAHTAERAGSADLQKTAGTARYMAPEVLAGGDVDVRADIFSLGVVLFELLTRHYPYEASIIMARYTTQLLHEVPPASSYNLNSPKALDTVLARALQVDPERRYPTVADFLADFLALDGPRRNGRAPLEDREPGGYGPLLLASLLVFVACTGLGLFVSRSVRGVGHPAVASRPLALPSVAATAEPTPLPSPSEATASPTPAPTPTARPPAQRTSWASAAEGVHQVTAQVERVTVLNGQTMVTLRVDNRSGDAVTFLNRSDRPDLFTLIDDRGHDYSRTLDFASVDPQLLRIEPGTQVTGAFHLTRPVDPTASSLELTLKEYEGVGRTFRLRAMRMVNGGPVLDN